MSIIRVPVYDRDHAPDLPPIQFRDHNWMGRIVSFIRGQDSTNVIYRVFIQALAISLSLALCISVVGIPLFLYGFKELITQNERARFDHLYVNIHSICTEHAKSQFTRGRLGPLDQVLISLPSSARKKMVRDLDLKPDEAMRTKDIDLLRMAAAKYTDYFVRYQLTVR